MIAMPASFHPIATEHDLLGPIEGVACDYCGEVCTRAIDVTQHLEACPVRPIEATDEIECCPTRIVLEFGRAKS